MSKTERILECESLMIRKSILDFEFLGLAGNEDNIKRFRGWCENGEIVRIVNTRKLLSDNIQLHVNNAGEGAIIIMGNANVNEYFMGYGITPTGNANHVVDFINGYKNLSYNGEYPHDILKYDTMELAYDINHIEEPTNEQYLMAGSRFINRVISIKLVENVPHATLIDKSGNVPQVEPLTDEDYIAIAKGVRDITKGGNIHFHKK